MSTKDIFLPKTERIKKLGKIFLNRIRELLEIFDAKTNIYIDYANVFYWFERLNWHIDLKRLKQFLDSFQTINKVKFYNGTLKNNKISVGLIKKVKK